MNNHEIESPHHMGITAGVNQETSKALKKKGKWVSNMMQNASIEKGTQVKDDICISSAGT